MYYYRISLLASPLAPLTYESIELLHAGDIVTVTLNKKIKQGVVLSLVDKPSFTCEQICANEGKSFLHVSLEIASFISEYYVCSLGEALGLFTPLLHTNPKPQTLPALAIELSSKQEAAFAFIQSHEKTLLFGDTGSGKTEVYIKSIHKCLQEGKNAILLMPEIGLTPQMKKRLKSHFGVFVAIWHSRITKSAKEKIIQDIEGGKVRIIAGTRSALFLPLERVGLIVVDEEHDDSYKSNANPRYNAKDLAHLFAKKYTAKLILGSATPSVGSYKNTPHFRLDETFHASSKKIVYEDMHNELSPSLLAKVEQYLEAKKQIIIFLPTRANFKYIACRECGENILCPHCSVGMSLHSDKNALVCHYCHFTQPIPKACPSCGCKEIEAKRIGTAEVVLQLKERFGDARIEKFDKDAITTHKKLNDTLKKLNENSIDILVGTQMLAKGHDYPNIALSIVMGIDTLLNIPDFRSREKALALIIQIAGRAGRNGEGEVYIQSKNATLWSKYIGNYELFLQEELAFRKELYPPFKKLMRILVSHKKEQKAQDILEQIKANAMKFPSVEVVGYGKADIAMIAGKYRYNILLRSSDTKALLQYAHLAKRYPVQIDVDPLSFS
ncbi:MAG: primosomal protein N' [Sulfurospirillum sp.]|nr:primosomal protein N' [Sulfurospirillum sp.]